MTPHHIHCCTPRCNLTAAVKMFLRPENIEQTINFAVNYFSLAGGRSQSGGGGSGVISPPRITTAVGTAAEGRRAACRPFISHFILADVQMQSTVHFYFIPLSPSAVSGSRQVERAGNFANRCLNL